MNTTVKTIAITGAAACGPRVANFARASVQGALPATTSQPMRDLVDFGLDVGMGVGLGLGANWLLKLLTASSK